MTLLVAVEPATGLCRVVLLGWLLTVGLANAAAAEEGEILTPPPGRSLFDFAAASIPDGTKAAHPVVSGRLGPFEGALIVLFHADDFREFHGWVLVPESGGYRKHVLPDVPQPVSTEVKAVFFADAGHDGRPELFVLAEHISGVGRYPANVRPFCSTYPFTWDGAEFVFLDDLSARLDRCNAAGVRKQLQAYRGRR